MKIIRNRKDTSVDIHFPKRIAKAGLPSQNDKRNFVQDMFDKTADKYDKTNWLITLGRDNAWRKKAVKRLNIKENSLVLDVASGTGDICNILEKQKQNTISLDFSMGMLKKSTTKVPKVQADALHMPFFDNTFDAVTCGFGLRNFTDIQEYFISCSRVLKPEGRFMALDATTPSNPLIKIFHTIWFKMVVPIIGRIFGSNKDAYDYLPISTAYLPSEKTLIEMLTIAEFKNVYIKKYMFGSVICITATSKG